MGTTAGQIYTEITDLLFEPGGFVLGIVTEEMFFEALAQTLHDFCYRTGIAREIWNIQAIAGTKIYDEPCGLADAVYVSYADTFLFPNSGFSMDQTGQPWFNSVGTPNYWREDELPIGQLQLIPYPSMTGNTIDATVPGYGTLNASSLGVDFVIGTTNPGYGVISDASTGDVYLSPVNEGFGTFNAMVPSNNNIQVVATAVPTQVPVELSDYIPLVPDTLMPYIKYGILDKLFSSDSEQKDVARAQYCRMRYTEGVTAMAALMSEDPIEDGGS